MINLHDQSQNCCLLFLLIPMQKCTSEPHCISWTDMNMGKTISTFHAFLGERVLIESLMKKFSWYQDQKRRRDPERAEREN